MTCDGIGQPKPSITWRKAGGGGKLPKDRATIRHGNLTIVSIKKEDHGKYECILENEIATLVAAATLHVDSKFFSPFQTFAICPSYFFRKVPFDNQILRMKERAKDNFSLMCIQMLNEQR